MDRPTNKPGHTRPPDADLGEFASHFVSPKDLAGLRPGVVLSREELERLMDGVPGANDLEALPSLADDLGSPPAPTAKQLLGNQLMDEVLTVHAGCPEMPAFAIFERVMERRRGARVEFVYRPEQAHWVAFGGLVVDAFLPYAPDELRLLDEGTPEEVSWFCEDDEDRPLHSLNRLAVHFELNGHLRREAWVDLFVATFLGYVPTAPVAQVTAFAERIWDTSMPPMRADACAYWSSRQYVSTDP